MHLRREGSARRAGIAALFGVMSIACGADAMAATAPAATDPSPQADRLWAKLLTTCGTSKFYAGSELDSGPNLYIRNPQVIEFRGVQLHRPVPIAVSPAERLNGVSAHARITMTATAYKVGGEVWRDGPGLRSRNGDDMGNQSFRQVMEGHDQIGTAGAMAFDLARIKGRWVIRRSSLYMSDSIAYEGTTDLEQFLGRQGPRVDCATRARIPSPFEKKVETIDPYVAEERAAEARRLAAEKRGEDHRLKVLGDINAHYDAMIRERGAIERPWRFAGTREEFRAALLTNLERRAKEFGIDAHVYEPDLAAIDRYIAACLSITPSRWEEVTAPLRVGRISDGQRNASLNNCDRHGWSWGEIVSQGRPMPLGLVSSMSEIPSTDVMHGFQLTGFLQVTVVLNPPVAAEEKRRMRYDRSLDLPARYNVIDARIVHAGEPLTPRISAWVRGEGE